MHQQLAVGSISHMEVTPGKPGVAVPGVASVACVAGHCSGEKLAQLMYAANGNIVFHLKTNTVFVPYNLELRPFDPK